MSLTMYQVRKVARFVPLHTQLPLVFDTSEGAQQYTLAS